MVKRTFNGKGLKGLLVLIMGVAVIAAMAVSVNADFDDIFTDAVPTYDYLGSQRTWIIGEPGHENDSAEWKCKSCGTQMGGVEPANCLECSSSDISKTAGRFLRDLLGNIRNEKDAFGRPIMDSTLAFFIVVTSAFIFGMIMSLLYRSVTKKGQPSSSNFGVTLVILPMIIAGVIFVVQENIAAAFGLSGIFSMTRFRNNVNNPKDISFIFVSMAIGLSCGMGYVFYGFAMSIILCMILLILNAVEFGEPKNVPKILRINVPESISYNEVFDSILEKYAFSWDVMRVKTVDLGATFEITYTLSLKKGINEKEFIDELRTRNGNLSIVLRLDDKR